MDASNLITWAVCAGLAWVIFANLTGVDDWLKSLFGRSKVSDLEQRVELLERRLAELDKK